MSLDAALVVTPLDASHERKPFACGNKALDQYLKRQARQDVQRRICRVYVAADPSEPSSILGFYTLSSCSIELTQLPESRARKLPKHPVPTALLGRLAVSQSHQGEGIGSMLLANAIRRTLAVSHEIGMYAMVVDAINDEARRFYERYGFCPLQSTGRRLFLPLQSL